MSNREGLAIGAYSEHIAYRRSAHHGEGTDLQLLRRRSYGLWHAANVGGLRQWHVDGDATYFGRVTRKRVADREV
jgi:hypothetical protein